MALARNTVGAGAYPPYLIPRRTRGSAKIAGTPRRLVARRAGHRAWRFIDLAVVPRRVILCTSDLQPGTYPGTLRGPRP
jgi:hypothetical protein